MNETWSLFELILGCLAWVHQLEDLRLKWKALTSELEVGMETASLPLNFNVRVTALTAAHCNDLFPCLSSPLDYVLPVGRDYVLFIYIPGIRHRVDAQVRGSDGFWTGVIAVGRLRTGQFLHTFWRWSQLGFLMDWVRSMQARVEWWVSQSFWLRKLEG